ncbi:hypothetical protein AB0K16_59560 [Nonomuraea jabiensis]|uniref:hypothetical protein n=1 Tax=Nonomuraea jabiensis TaxID=882448 RepID=UPI003425A96A
MNTAITVAIIAALGAFVTACVQYVSKVREEKRLAQLAQVEMDTRIAASFAALMSRAHGRGETVLSESTAQGILQDGGAFTQQVQETLAKVARGEEGPEAVRRVDLALETSLRTYGVGTADMDAAIQVIAALGLRHPILTRAAVVGVRGRNEFRPVDGAAEIIDALQRREAYDARLLRWARKTRPAYWLKRSPQRVSPSLDSTTPHK